MLLECLLEDLEILEILVFLPSIEFQSVYWHIAYKSTLRHFHVVKLEYRKWN
jgi:hypothetical protein